MRNICDPLAPAVFVGVEDLGKIIEIASQLSQLIRRIDAYPAGPVTCRQFAGPRGNLLDGAKQVSRQQQGNNYRESEQGDGDQDIGLTLLVGKLDVKVVR